MHQAPNRQLDFSTGPPLSNGGISPQRTLLKPHRSSSSSRKGRNKRPFDLTGLDDEEEQILNDENAEVIANGLAYDDEPFPLADDNGLVDFDTGSFGDHVEESIEHDDSHVDGEPSTMIDAENLDQPGDEQTPVFNKKRGESGRMAPVAQMFDPDLSRVSTSATGRKSKNGKAMQRRAEVYEDPDPGSVVNRSRARGKVSGKKAPRERDPNARPNTVPKSAPKALPIRAGSVGPRGGSYQVQRSETPATDSGAVVTRSGRASYKPLASWRGEKVIFGQRPDWETPASVTDIIRTDEIQIPPPPRKKVTRKTRARSELEEIEEEAEDLDPWETETGIMHAQVMRWDQEAGKYDENDAEEAGM